MAQYRSLQDVVRYMDPEIHMNMKTAVELGRWANGERLTSQQLENCMQAIIAYEQMHLPEHERVGFIDRAGLKKTLCDDTGDDTGFTGDSQDGVRGDQAQVLRWVKEQQ